MLPESNPPELDINIPGLKKAAVIIRALNHPLRQQIIQLIHENHRITVTSMFVQLHLEQSIVSQHLAILRAAGYVHTQREGKRIFYSVNYTKVKKINQTSEQLNTMVAPV